MVFFLMRGILQTLIWIMVLGGIISRAETPSAAGASSAPMEVIEAAETVPMVVCESAIPAEAPVVATPVPAASGTPRILVIPVQDVIDKPVLYVLRRGLKMAIDQGMVMVVLDMKTPGGRLDVTFDIMEALDRFEGATATLINDEAISAGAFISAMTDEIYFVPRGVIGAAAPVMSTGGEIDESMKQKIVSFLRARVRSISEGHLFRGEVISAMIDADYELKIGDEVLKPKGELLTLTASEAAKVYSDGTAEGPLLAAGIVDSVEELLDQRFGSGAYEVVRLEVTWSEELAQFLNGIAPILLGLGLLGLFIEFKTPGFGVFGVLGGALLGIVFLSNYAAGLSGHEPALVFALGAVLVLVELLFIPGIVILALTGILMMLGSLVWAMADFWPNEPLDLSSDVLVGPLNNMALGAVVAVVGGLLVMRFLPRGWVWDRLVLAAAVGGPQAQGSAAVDALVGATGVAATALFPGGQVEVDGHRYEAHLTLGTAEAGARVRVVQRREFELVVELVPEDSA